MIYTIKLNREQAVAVINALQSVISDIQEQASEQEQSLADKLEQKKEE